MAYVSDRSFTGRASSPVPHVAQFDVDGLLDAPHAPLDDVGRFRVVQVVVAPLLGFRKAIVAHLGPTMPVQGETETKGVSHVARMALLSSLFADCFSGRPARYSHLYDLVFEEPVRDLCDVLDLHSEPSSEFIRREAESARRVGRRRRRAGARVMDAFSMGITRFWFYGGEGTHMSFWMSWSMRIAPRGP